MVTAEQEQEEEEEEEEQEEEEEEGTVAQALFGQRFPVPH